MARAYNVEKMIHELDVLHGSRVNTKIARRLRQVLVIIKEDGKGETKIQSIMVLSW